MSHFKQMVSKFDSTMCCFILGSIKAPLAISWSWTAEYPTKLIGFCINVFSRDFDLIFHGCPKGSVCVD